MKLIDRYLGTTIIGTTLLVLTMLLGLAIFIIFVKEIGDIGTGQYGLLAAFEYVLLDLPQQLYEFFPMASLLGVLLGLSLLANHSELTVLRSSGLSLGRITWAVMKAAILMLFIATIIGEGLAPFTQHHAQAHKELLTSSGQALKTMQGTWLRDKNNYIYIRTVIGNNYLQDVLRDEFNDQHQLIRETYAEKGRYVHGHWIMENVVSSNISAKKITTSTLATEDWSLTFNPNLLKIAAVDPNEMSLSQLSTYIDYLYTNNLDTSRYRLAFWQRVLQPLATLVMIWLAIPFIFGPLRSKTLGLRMILGIVIGFSFYILNEFFGPLSVLNQWPPFLAAILPTLLFAGAAYYLQQRVR